MGKSTPAAVNRATGWTRFGLRFWQRIAGRLIERKILPTPLLYLSAFFEATRSDYYDGLRGVSERGVWSDWLEYFLLGVARMSEDALRRATRIYDLLVEWRRKLAGRSTETPLRMVDMLAANPFLTVTGAAAELKLAFTTAQRAIEHLERSGILQQVSGVKRNRVYLCKNAARNPGGARAPLRRARTPWAPSAAQAIET
jgi:Fic family protein